MRIAIVHNLPSGGGLRSLAAVTRWLARRHELALWVPASAERDFLALGDAVGASEVIPFTSRATAIDGPFRRTRLLVARYLDLQALHAVWRRVARAIDAGGFDVVLVNPCHVFYSPPLLGWLETPSAFLMQEVFRYVHEPEIARPWTGGAKNAAVRWLYLSHFKALLRTLDRKSARAADRIIANSSYARARIAATYDVDPVIARPEIDTGKFRPLDRAREGHVLTVGALDPTKGHDLVIEALGRIDAASRPPLELVFDRENPRERHFLSERARDRGVELRLRHRLSEEGLVEAYNRAALFVYAPVREPLGYGPLEAQACGLPVVGVAEGGVNETVVDGETGLLTPRDPAAFAAAVTTLLTDDARREEFGRAGVANVRENWRDGFGARVETILTGLAGARSY